jgi:hypothetical protein
VRITLQNNTTNSDEDSGSIYGRIGTRVFGRAELGVGDLLCTFQTGSRTCTVDVPVGQTLTLASQEVSAINFGTFAGAPPRPDWLKRTAQFVGWSGPCAAPEPGVCVLQATSDQTVTALWKPMALTEVAFVGVREWRVTIEARPLLAIGSLWTGAPQRYRNEFPAGTLGFCLGGPTPAVCRLGVTPDAAQLTLESLPPRSPPPMGAGAPLEWRGFGDACAIAGTGTTCTLAALGTQRTTLKWEYYLCTNAGGGQTPDWGLAGWRFASPPDNCTLQQP